MVKSCNMCCIVVGKDGKLDAFAIWIYGAKNEITYYLFCSTFSGKMLKFSVMDKDSCEPILLNGYHALFNPDDSIDHIVDPKGNIV